MRSERKTNELSINILRMIRSLIGFKNIQTQIEDKVDTESDKQDINAVVNGAKKEAAAITIQKNFRGYLARKKYRIKNLEKHQQTSYRTFVVGTDPVMPKELNSYCEKNEKIALIATSGMRAISLACKIGNTKNIPKIIIIDNSREVCEFWHAMKEFVSDADKAENADEFLQNLPSFLKQHKHLYRDLKNHDVPPGRLNQNINIYFDALIGKYGYKHIRAVILHASVIKQSWADPDLFVKLKNILSFLSINKVYMYPSNIVASIDDQSIQNQILENIKNFRPTLSIHANYCPHHHISGKVYLFDRQDPKYVMNSLFSRAKVRSRPSDDDMLKLLTRKLY